MAPHLNFIMTAKVRKTNTIEQIFWLLTLLTVNFLKSWLWLSRFCRSSLPFPSNSHFLFVFVESLFCFVFQNGDCVTMEKPIPCKKTMIKMSNEEFVQRMSVINIAISILTKCGNCNTLFYFSHLMEQQWRLKIVDHFYCLEQFKHWPMLLNQGDWRQGLSQQVPTSPLRIHKDHEYWGILMMRTMMLMIMLMMMLMVILSTRWASLCWSNLAKHIFSPGWEPFLQRDLH